MASFGTEGNQSGQFNLPTSVIIDSQGDLYVNERGNDRIQKLDSDGNPILMWGSKGSGYSQFCHMEHLAIDKFDNIYVTEIHSRFQDVAMKLDPPNLTETVILSHNGNFLEFREGTNLDPEHLAIDSQGNVYISERGGDQIQVYRPVPNDNSAATTKS